MFLSILLTASLLAAAPAKPAPKKPVPKAIVKKSGKATGRSLKSSNRRVVHRPAAPRQPSADRNREIQQALAERGYLKGEPDGQWTADSIAALKRFEQDQNMKVDGKLDSLSLIALGLGPKRTPPQGIQK